MPRQTDDSRRVARVAPGTHGLNCSVCGGNTFVTDSRPDKAHTHIRRRRRCEECGTRFTTVEMPTDLQGTLPTRRELEALKLVAVSLTNQLSRILDKLPEMQHGHVSRRIQGPDVDVWSEPGLDA